MRKYAALAALFIGLLVGRAFAVTAPQLYVGNYGQPGILSWPPSTTGNIAPTTNLSGANTTFSGTSGVAIDASGNVWAGEYNNDKIFKFNAGTTGNIAPVVTITPPVADIRARWLAFDSNGYLYVVDSGITVINIYSPAQLAATGSPTPNGIQSGAGNSATTLGSIVAVALGPDNKIYVADNSSNPGTAITVDIFAASTAGGTTAPVAQIAGSNTGFGAAGTNVITGVWVDATGKVYVTGGTLNEIYEWNSGNTGNVAPDTTIVGAGTGLNSPQGIITDAAGKIYVANNGNNTITVYSSGASGNASPAQTISGASTLINSPFELALWPVAGTHTENGFFFAP